MNTSSARKFSWRDVLTASRDVSNQDRARYEINLTWYERWRCGKNLNPGRDSAREFWKDQVLAKERKSWQLEQWAAAIRWFLRWRSFCEQQGANGLSVAERVYRATHSSGARRGYAESTRHTYADVSSPLDNLLAT